MWMKRAAVVAAMVVVVAVVVVDAVTDLVPVVYVQQSTIMI